MLIGVWRCQPVWAASLKSPSCRARWRPPQSRENQGPARNSPLDLEADIDRLIFKVMGVGDLTEIEDSLRQARRLLDVSADER